MDLRGRMILAELMGRDGKNLGAIPLRFGVSSLSIDFRQVGGVVHHVSDYAVEFYGKSIEIRATESLPQFAPFMRFVFTFDTEVEGTWVGYYGGAKYPDATNAWEIDRGVFSTKQPKLILVTHGWHGTSTDWPLFARDSIAEAIRRQPKNLDQTVRVANWSENDTDLDLRAWPPADWLVVSLDWTQNANTLVPQGAERRAMALGKKFGSIAQLSGFSSCHLIAHSAGSWLIDAMADAIKDHDIKEGGETDIRLTFLDSYAQGPPSNTYMKLGAAADWAEHFVCSESPPTIVVGTDWTLPNAFNVDITTIKPPGESSHSWPWKWYITTITNPSSASSLGWGFGRTAEYSGSFPSFVDYPRGRRLDIASGLLISAISASAAISSGVELRSESMEVSATGQVGEFGFGGFTMTTGSPVSAATTLDLANGDELLSFNFEFLPGGRGTLNLLLDDEVVFGASTSNSIGFESAGWIALTDLIQPGLHRLKWQLTPQTALPCKVRISNVASGFRSNNIEMPLLNAVLESGAIHLRWSTAFEDFSLKNLDFTSGGWNIVPATVIKRGGFLNASLRQSKVSELFILER